MRTRYGISPWIDRFPTSRRPDYPRLRGEHKADVVIVGGGLTGCVTAYACAVAGLETVVVERDRIARGSAGRSAGLLLPEPGPGFRDVEWAHGLKLARTAFETWRRASLDAAALLRRLRIKCALEPIDTVIVAARGDDRVLRREHEARTRATLESSWLTPRHLKAIGIADAPAGIRFHDAFGLDPYRAAVGVAAAAAAKGTSIFEHSDVKKVKATRTGVEVVTDGGLVSASTVVVTTGSAGAEFKQLRRHFKRRESYLVLTEPVPAAIRKQIAESGFTFSDTRRPHHRIRWTSDDRLLVAGAEQDETPERSRPAVLVQRTGQLMYELLTMFPAISGLMPEYGWEVGAGDTADGLMYIGPHRNHPHHLFALGGGGDSITGAFLAARILVRALQQAPDKRDAVWEFTR